MEKRNLYTDPALMLRLRSGDQEAFKKIFDLWFNKLYYFSFKYLKSKEHAEEVVQETMLQLWLTREKLDENYPVSPYLFTIARRLSLNSLRQIASSKSATQKLFERTSFEGFTTDEDLSLAELRRLTERAILLMPKQQQLVYQMSRNEGLSLDQIAERLGITKNTTKKHLSEALKVIKKQLMDAGVAWIVTLFL